MLIGTSSEKYEIPHESGEWVELRKLSARQLRKCEKERQKEVMSLAREMGADIFKALQGVETPDREVDVRSRYHLDTLLELAIESWSYDEPVSKENIGRLDEQTEQFIVSKVLGVEPEEEAKKGS